MNINLIKNTLNIIEKEFDSTEDINEKYSIIKELLKFSEYIDFSKKELFHHLGKKYEFCEKCDKWYPINKFDTVIDTKIYEDTPFNYPETNNLSDLKICDKEVECTYHICPKCHNKRIVKTVTTKYVFNGKGYDIKHMSE